MRLLAPIQFILCLILIACVNLSLAATQDSGVAQARARLEQLLLHDRRPTVADVVKAVGEYPEALNGLVDPRAGSRAGSSTDLVFKHLASAFRDEIPKVVTFLEVFYPGATFATLGRDAFPIADVLEAFYLALGIPNRVVRLGASTSTFNALGAPGMKLEFLKSNGLNLEQAASRARPFVILDRTSFGHASQSTTLMRAIFESPEITDAMRQEIYTTINVVSSVSGLEYDFSVSGLHEFLEGHGAPSNLVRRPPLMLPASLMFAPLRRLTDIDALNWHSTYLSKLETLPDGRITGVAPSAHEGDRVLTLQVFWWLYETMKRPSTLASIWNSAREAGFDLKRQLANDRGRDEIRRQMTRHRGLAHTVARTYRALFDDKDWETLTPKARGLIFDEARVRTAKWLRRLPEKTIRNEVESRNEFHHWNQLAARRRRHYPMRTRFGKVALERIGDLPKIDVSNAQPALGQWGTPGYYSQNAQAIYDLHYAWRSTVQMAPGEAAEMLRLAAIAARAKKITPLDAARLSLVALSYADETIDVELSTLREVIESDADIKRALVENYALLLKNRKYNHGQARSVYVALLENGILPSNPQCEARLLAPSTNGNRSR